MTHRHRVKARRSSSDILKDEVPEPMPLLSFFPRLYYRPARALSEILDHATLLSAVITAVAACGLVYVSSTIQAGRFSSAYLQNVKKRPATPPPAAAPSGNPQGEADVDEPQPSPELYRGLLAMALNLGPIGSLVGACLCAVPISILMITAWDSLGGYGVVLRRDTLPVLMCVLFGWSAAFAPAAILAAVLPLPFAGAAFLAAGLYFAFLFALSLRIVLRTSFWRAAVSTILGCVLTVPASMLYAVAGPYLLSPFVLYYGWIFFGGEVRGLGSELHSRQNLRRQLESLTLNPRDADAHYQIGLIYEERRLWEDALARFQKAAEIDATDAGILYHLGRMEAKLGRWQEALGHFRAAAALDDKLASSDVWRETGVACFHLGELDAAAAALGKFVERREYDPEGLCWYGRTLAALSRKQEAAVLFRRAIEAADTMPPKRRAEVREWRGAARKELSALGS